MCLPLCLELGRGVKYKPILKNAMVSLQDVLPTGASKTVTGLQEIVALL